MESAWSSWREIAVGAASGDRDSEDIAPALQAVGNAVSALSMRACEELERRDDAWHPIAREVRDWLPAGRDTLSAGFLLKDPKAAETWLRDAAGDLRAERLAPIAQAARANWERLRQNSNVELGAIALVRSGNTRSAQFDVRVDETGAPAFGVMSQGELNSLAISVFLPRSGRPESPFRYVVIDDPVQSMDPSKVDGLARILAATAEQRQVLSSRTTTACRSPLAGWASTHA